MIKKLYKVNTSSEINSLALSLGFELNKHIVNKCFELYEMELEEVLIISIITIDTNQKYDITVKKEDMIETLHQNIHIFEQNEDYDGCIKIRDLIKEIEDGLYV